MTNTHPQVSVVLPTYNRASFLDRAVKSVLGQSFRDFALVVCDDASSDDTPSVVRELARQDSRIVYVRNERNLGLTRNYNKALREARGMYVAFIDDDDPWLDADKLKKQVEFLDAHEDYAGAGGGMIVVDREGRELMHFLKPESDAAIRRCMLFSNPMANSTTMFRKSAAEKVGFYDEILLRAADRDFWLKMGKAGKLYNFPEYFAYYTVAGQNSLFRNQRELFRFSLRIIRRYKGDYPNYFPAALFHCALLAYSFLPERFRVFLNMPFFYLKRKAFDHTRR